MSSSASLSPRVLAGRYRIGSRLGRGGMGEVYEAWDTELQRTVAVKTLIADHADPQSVERLLREARACAGLKHPGIVTIHDVLQVEGSVHIVMEHVPGTSLASLPRPPRFSSLEAKLDIIIQILDALHYAHEQGVVHRDVKPANVQLLPDGSVKLLDFGIARIAGATALTMAGSVMGTIHYASPEQLRGENCEATTDIYSTGILAYELLTRRLPFDADSAPAVLNKVQNAPLPPMGTWLTESFPDVEGIIGRAAAKPKEQRYQNAKDMKNAVVAFLASSREAILHRQAEVAASSERRVIEARRLIANDRVADAIPLLTSVLQTNPDADEARGLLQGTDGAEAGVTSQATHETEAAGPSQGIPGAEAAAPSQATRGTAAGAASHAIGGTAAGAPSQGIDGAEAGVTSPGIAGTAAGVTSQAARGTEAGATRGTEPAVPPNATDCDLGAGPEPSSPPWFRRRAVAAAPLPVALLTGAVLFGSFWAQGPLAPPPLFPPDAPTAEPLDPVTPDVRAENDGASGSLVDPAAPSSAPNPRPRRPTASASPPAGPVAPALPESGAGEGAGEPLPDPAPPALLVGAMGLYHAAAPPSPAPWPRGEIPPAPVVAANGPANAGLKYRIFRRGPDGEAVAVDADTQFRSGDRIRFGFESNVDGFLYVLQRGSSGRWSVLLPHPMIAAGSNRVTGFREVTIPSATEGWWLFDENPGTEEVFVYLSREPLDPSRLGGGPVVRAESVDESVVLELANSVRTRDLVFEPVDASDAPDADRAAYVVNRADAKGAVAWTIEVHHR